MIAPHAGLGGIDERGRQSDEPIDPRALAFAPGAEVFGEEPGRDARAGEQPRRERSGASSTAAPTG